jgi:hypothetical protein
LSRWINKRGKNKIEDSIFDNTGNLVSFCNDAACDAKAVEYLYGATLEPICMAERVCQQRTMTWKETRSMPYPVITFVLALSTIRVTIPSRHR